MKSRLLFLLVIATIFNFGKLQGQALSVISIDSRSINYLPQDRNAGAYFDFKFNTTDGLSDANIYHGVMTFRPWGGTGDFTGGLAHQLAFTDNGNMWLRSGSITTWSNWLKIYSSKNLNRSDVDLTAKNIYANGTISSSGTINSNTAYDVPAVQFSRGSYFRSNGTYVDLQQNGPDADKTFYINGFSNILKDQNIVYHAGNFNRSDIDLNAKNLNSRSLRLTNNGKMWDISDSGNSIAFNESGIQTSLFLQAGGNVGIGTTAPQNKLDVNGTIHAKEVKVDLTGWSDFVFAPTYKLKTLAEVETYIKTQGHLPEIPSATEVEKNGVNVGEMQTKLLQKVEELTLYVIEKDKQLSEQDKKYQKLEAELEQLKAIIKTNITKP